MNSSFHLFRRSRKEIWGSIKDGLTDAFITLFLVVLVLGATAPASRAQAPTPVLTVSTGKITGSYYKFMTQVKSACPSPAINVVASEGSSENLERLEANTANGAVVQLDALALYGKQRKALEKNVRVLLPLFSEELHFITTAKPVLKTGGWGVGKLNFGEKDVQFNTIADLKGYPVAATGGGFVTGQMLTKLGWDVRMVEFRGSSDELMKKLFDGTYAAILMVGAQPLGTIGDLPPEQQVQLKLLPVPPAYMASFQAVYKDATTLSYRNMSQGGTPIPTVSVNSALVTQDYRRGKVAQATWALRECIVDAAPDMAATLGMHPAWRAMKPDLVTAWPKYDKPEGLTSTSSNSPAQPEPVVQAQAKKK